MSQAAENHTTSRRSLLVIGAAAAAAAGSSTAAATTSPPPDRDVDAELLALWRRWRSIMDETEAACIDMSRLQEAHPDLIDTPRVEFRRGSRLYAYSDEDIDRHTDNHIKASLFAFGSEGPRAERIKATAEACRAKLKRQLSELQEARPLALVRSGIKAAENRYEDLCARGDALHVKIIDAPARGAIGFAVKVAVALRWMKGDGAESDYPQAFLASLAADLLPHLPADLAASLRPQAGRVFARDIEACLEAAKT